MAKLKYKDKDGFWQELPVGTNVVANPMLTGTEQELTSLKVGDTKYKMPAGGGKLYSYKFDNQLLVPYSQVRGPAIVYVNLQFYLPYLTDINTYEKLRVVCEKIYGDSTYIPVTFHSAFADTYYSGALCFYKSGEDNYVRFFFGGISSNASDSSLTALEYSSPTNPLRPALDEDKKQWSDTVSLTVTEL